MLRLKENVDLKKLKKYGFECEDGVWKYFREIDGIVCYYVVVTMKHHNIQIVVNEPCRIAGTLQCLLYDLIKDGLVEVV